MTGPTTPTPSLRRRVTVATVGLIAILLLALGAAIDEVVEVQLNRDLESRLADDVVRAANLVKVGVGPAELVAQLQAQRIRVQVIGPDGTRYGDRSLDTSASPPPPPQTGPVQPPTAKERSSKAVTRVLRDGSTLIMVAKTNGIQARRAQLRRDLLIGGTATLILIAVLVRLVVGRALAPLQRITSTAEQITHGDRGRRLRPDRPTTELGHAAAAFDNMLDALETAETNARRAAEAAQRAESKTRRFLSDAAHELRSPVTAIQAVAQQLTASTEGTGHDDASLSRLRRYAALLGGETRRAGRLVSDLLDIAGIDAGAALRNEQVDLVDVVAAEVERAAMLAPSVTVRLVGDDARLPIRADPGRITQILSNVLDNARRYTPRGGEITVRTAARDRTAEVTVVDSGPGIPDADRERVFDRLVRLDDARDRGSGGAGLGLSIARGLAEAHHGTLECLPHEPGAAFRLSLPLAPPSAPAGT